MVLPWHYAIAWLAQMPFCLPLNQDQAQKVVSNFEGGSMTRLQTLVSSSSHKKGILEVDFSDPSSASKTIDTLMSVRAHGPRFYIREISVTGYPSLGDWTLLENVFAQLKNIEAVHWQAWKAIPPKIVRYIEQKSPSTRLHYTPRFTHKDPYDSSLEPEPDWDPYDNPRDTNYELREERDRQHKLDLKSIVNSTCLYALKANIEYNSDDNFDDLELVFDAISNAPNLRELDLHFSTTGCITGHSPYAFDFLLRPLVRFPPLEVLRLTSYGLDEGSDGGYVWGWKDFPEDPRRSWNYETDGLPSVPRRSGDDGRSNLDAWLEIMDWTNLHTLEITNPSPTTLKRLRGNVLPSLKHLALKGGSRSGNSDLAKATMSFIMETVQPLESLRLQPLEAFSLGALGDAPLQYKTELWSSLLSLASLNTNIWRGLKRFSLGNKENTAFIDQRAISTFLLKASKLEHLDLNIPRPSTGDWDHSNYSYLLSSTTVSQLTLRFLTPDAHFAQIYDNDTIREEYRAVEKATNLFTPELDIIDPLVNTETVLQLFKGLRSEKQGGVLKKLEVYVGNWDKRSGCEMMDPRTRVAFYECCVRLDGKEVCEGEQTRTSGAF